MGRQTKAQQAEQRDARQLTAYQEALENLATAAKAVNGIGTHNEWKVLKFIEAQQAEVTEGIAIIERRMAQRTADAEQAANSDRAKVKRAFAALRKQGFAVSVNEPGYESTKEHSFPIAEAQHNREPYAFVARQRWNYAFTDRYARSGEGAGDTLVNDLNINWGPDTDPRGEADDTVAVAIRSELEAEGLTVEHTSHYNCVTVKAAS